MDQCDWNWRHIVAVYWWCDCWWKEHGGWWKFMELYSHQPKGAKLTEVRSTVRRKTPSPDFNLDGELFCRYRSIFRLSECRWLVWITLSYFCEMFHCCAPYHIIYILLLLFWIHWWGVHPKYLLTGCGHRNKSKGKEHGRCWICTKAVFEQEQNAKQATESSPAERAELKTLAGTTQSALSMWPELKTTYGVFRNNGDPKNPPKKWKKACHKCHNSHFRIFGRTDAIWDVSAAQRPLQRGKK